MRVWVDRACCIGSGKCAVNAPSVFQLDDDDKSVAIDPEGRSVEEHCLLAVAKDCPTGAIHIEGDEGERIYP
jgi:ferredoxin